MSHNDPDDRKPLTADRRVFLGGLAALGAATVAGPGGTAEARTKVAAPRSVRDADLAAIETVVVIYAENRSFNNLFADFPGLAEPLSQVPPERTAQRDRDGSVMPHLPKIWEGLVPEKQVVQHREYQIGPDDLAAIPNGAFALKTPDGDPLPHGLVTRDLIHAFYQNQMQINGGKNDGFAAWGDSGGLVMGHYGDMRSQLRLWQTAREFTLCDNFFMGAFGGSFLNHQYLVAACPPIFPDADKSPAAKSIAELEGNDPTGTRLKLNPKTPASALDGPAKFVASTLTPDFYAVNTMLPPDAPTYQLDPANPAYGDPTSSHTLVAQKHHTIGDMLSARGDRLGVVCGRLAGCA